MLFSKEKRVCRNMADPNNYKPAQQMGPAVNKAAEKVAKKAAKKRERDSGKNDAATHLAVLAVLHMIATLFRILGQLTGLNIEFCVIDGVLPTFSISEGTQAKPGMQDVILKNMPGILADAQPQNAVEAAKSAIDSSPISAPVKEKARQIAYMKAPRKPRAAKKPRAENEQVEVSSLVDQNVDENVDENAPDELDSYDQGPCVRVVTGHPELTTFIGVATTNAEAPVSEWWKCDMCGRNIGTEACQICYFGTAEDKQRMYPTVASSWQSPPPSPPYSLVSPTLGKKQVE